jgi:tetratricopeptide (TPR) repeat protein
MGSVFLASSLGFVIGPLEMWAGNPAAAEEELRANCATLQELGERAWLCSIASFLAEALYVQGKDEEADHWVEVCRETASTDDLEAQADWRCIKGKVLARQGRLEEAVPLVREGLAFAQRADEIDHIADAWADVFRVLRMAGLPEEAADAAREAIATYERKGNLAAAANVRRELAG